MYLIRKDGLWLTGYRQTGIREIINGGLENVPTAVYSNDRRSAKEYGVKAQAEFDARRFGGEVITVPGVRAGKEAQADAD